MPSITGVFFERCDTCLAKMGLYFISAPHERGQWEKISFPTSVTVPRRKVVRVSDRIIYLFELVLSY